MKMQSARQPKPAIFFCGATAAGNMLHYATWPLEVTPNEWHVGCMPAAEVRIVKILFAARLFAASKA
jgi:hypothetical protein